MEQLYKLIKTFYKKQYKKLTKILFLNNTGFLIAKSTINFKTLTFK